MHKNMKRNVEASFGQHFYDISAFGKRFLLNLTRNENLLGPNFHIEIRHPDGSVIITAAPHGNFFHGHVVSEPESIVAVGDNEGLVSAIDCSHTNGKDKV